MAKTFTDEVKRRLSDSRSLTAVKPSETLFVVDAMTGQDAVNTAKEFNERLDFDDVVLTKLDGDTRRGRRSISIVMRDNTHERCAACSLSTPKPLSAVQELTGRRTLNGTRPGGATKNRDKDESRPKSGNDIWKND